MMLRSRATLWLGLGLGLALGACGSDDAGPDACTQASTELYRQRIEPILTSDDPKSCNECHLSGVDLTVFVRGTPCQTMACMIVQGLVDLEAPEQSKVLSWIERASPDSELITDAVIQKEYDAFYDWIASAAECGACANSKCPDEGSRTFCDLDVEPSEPYDETRDPGGCEDKTLEQLFLETIYVARGRCYPCHVAGTENPPAGALPWLVEAENCTASSLATLRNITRAGLIDTDDPLQSLFLLKPLAESDGGVAHGGHDKIVADHDPAYDNIIYFLERYAECQAPAAD